MSVSALPRPAHWLTEERCRVYSIIVLAGFVAGYIGLTALSLPDFVDPRGKPVGYDFITFWSAAWLALHGRPEAAFDWHAIAAAQSAAVPAMGEKLFLWHYPPTFLLAVLPLGLMPYLAAFAAFTAAGLALWAGLIRRVVTDRRYWIIAAAMPAGLINFFHGQNGFFTAALAGFALLLLESQPVVAGVLIGLLAIKPHLAVLFPIALIASGNRRAFAAAAVTATGFSAVSIAAFGWPAVLAFVHDMPTAGMLIDEGILPWGMMPSPYVFGLGLGLPKALAWALQAAAAIAAAAGVWWVWRQPRAPFAAKAATLLTGALLISPYVFYYDMTWAGIAVGLLALSPSAADGPRGARDILFAAWVAPIAMVPIYKLTHLQLGAVVLLLLLGLAIRRAVDRNQDTSARRSSAPA
ncbi:MAG TPA: glycosyltransferase family 87 protein [Stellaceae bacterium]|nr:glycosyltransferase family 87 protein [Stellaceae bacterium]